MMTDPLFGRTLPKTARMSAAMTVVSVLAAFAAAPACALYAQNAPAAQSAQATTAAATAAAAAAAVITPEDVLRHLRVIAHDSMAGRDTPSRGLELTAGYIAAQFRAAGLTPAGDSGTFLQRYPISLRQLDKSVRMLQIKGDETFRPVFGTDYFAIPSANDDIEAVPYYAGIVTRNFTIPRLKNASIIIATIPDSMGDAWGARYNELVVAAAGAGAKAIVIELSPRMTRASVSEVSDAVSGVSAPLTVFGVRSEVLAPIMLAGHTNAAAPGPMTGVTLRLSAIMSEGETRVPNVVGILRGSDPALRDEYVIYSAHMDHVGIGAPDLRGDNIYNGADDDGSGTTAIIEMARAFASLKVAPARSIIFVTVSGEEKGLFGSRYFTDNLPAAADNMVADINIDMIGRNNPDSVTAVGADYTSLGRVADAIAGAHPELHLAVAPDRQPEEHLFLRSDHFNFARKDIPAIFFTTGLHDDYHRPSDEVSTIDTDKLARVARLAFFIGLDVASTRQKPKWTSKGREVMRAARGRR